MEIQSFCGRSTDIAPNQSCELSCGSLVIDLCDVTNSQEEYQPPRHCDVSDDITTNDQGEPFGDDSCNGQPDWSQEMTIDEQPPSITSQDHHEPSDDLTTNDQGELLGHDTSNLSQEMTMDDQRQPFLCNTAQNHPEPFEDIVTNDQGEPLGDDTSNGRRDLSQEMTMDDERQPSLSSTTQDHHHHQPSDEVTTSDQGEAYKDVTTMDNCEPSHDVRPDDPNDASHDVKADDPNNTSFDVRADDPNDSSHDVKADDPDDPSHDVRADDPNESFQDIRPDDPDEPSHDVRADDPNEPPHNDMGAGNQRRPSIGVCYKDAILAQFWQVYESGDLDSVHSFLENDEFLAQGDRVLQQTVLYHQLYWGI